MGEWLGYQMRLTLNTATLAKGDYTSTADLLLIESAGPIITLLQGVFFYWLIRCTANSNLFVFLFLAFFMRALAFLASFLSPNDEARIAIELGMPFWTVPSIITGALGVLVVVAARKPSIGTTSMVVLSLTSFVAVVTIIVADGIIFF